LGITGPRGRCFEGNGELSGSESLSNTSFVNDLFPSIALPTSSGSNLMVFQIGKQNKLFKVTG